MAVIAVGELTGLRVNFDDLAGVSSHSGAFVVNAGSLRVS
ncbi:hypothetical protein FRD01_10020 [Microvenator marinus]|uniref:Uncharacterized protein n=1 Tax=Microvenator marinus TaxID=2600177 RepID=A0A5B8XZA8_9DELT|nr:hypothetical protein FRD01_10020 [Microvenator marinus]